jgi:FliI/YscN family ATPase
VTGRGIGSVVGSRGQLLEAELPFASVGQGVRITGEGVRLGARVAALQGPRVLLAAFGALDRIAAGDRVEADPDVLSLPLGTPLLGRAIAADGAPLDGKASPRGTRRAVDAASPPLAARRPCTEVCWTGVRVIDGPLAFGRGARIGLFGSPGAGKSTLLEAVVRGADVDAVVVALIGERGREAERWLARLDSRTTIVCATSDRAAAERVRAAEVAFAQAGALCERGLDVLLVVDSLARVCAAARELALASGEPVGRAGYPPSVFALLARLLEQAGALASGSVTLLATVLSDGPDEHDPVSEAARATLDGHVVLSERLARAGRFPAVDVPRSASRTFSEVASGPHRVAASLLRAALAALEESREARALGLDPAAGDPVLARAVALEPEIERFLRQDGTPSSPERTLTELLALADRLG